MQKKYPWKHQYIQALVSEHTIINVLNSLPCVTPSASVSLISKTLIQCHRRLFNRQDIIMYREQQQFSGREQFSWRPRLRDNYIVISLSIYLQSNAISESALWSIAITTVLFSDRALAMYSASILRKPEIFLNMPLVVKSLSQTLVHQVEVSKIRAIVCLLLLT